MRDIFTEIFENQPIDPMVSARRDARGRRCASASMRKRHVGEDAGDGFPVLLDGKPVRTPARHTLAAPVRALAEQIAKEWDAQTDVINPGRMPLTRLANAVIDAVAAQPQAVTEEVAKYLGSDLLCYRAAAPPGLVARHAQLWDPILTWVAEALGARFILGEGIMHVAQPAEAIAAARAAIPADPWRLGAVALVTTLTGSALLALALSAGRIDADTAWAAANADEDWQMEFWGRDEAALERRAYRRAELDAAAAVLKTCRHLRCELT